MRPPVRLLFFVVCLPTIGTLGGCSDSGAKTYPVRGIVRFPDGKVLRDGSVEFEIVGRDPPVTATGSIGPDGSFVLGTYQADDGALVGKHRVVVIADYVIGNGPERPGLIPESMLHEKYRSFKTSGLVREVKPETNNIVIEVEYASDPPPDESGR
jgi:hypothetical protein